MDRILDRAFVLPRQLSLALEIVLFALLMVLAAYVYLPLPFSPVPVTLQTLVVLVAAARLGRMAALSLVLYLTLGVAGLPVFAGAWSGFARIIGPTGGYLIGFLSTAFLVGWIIEAKARNHILTLAAMVGGTLLILILGTIRLSLLFKLDPIEAFYIGMLPFLPGDIIKAAIAWLVMSGWRPLNAGR